MTASTLAPPPALAVGRETEAVIAWRTWKLSGRRDGTNLRLGPVAGHARRWPPGRASVASCRMSLIHGAPHLGCTCGLYGTHGPDLLRRTKSPTVIGRVALWGRVIEHELGYRGQFAYPQRLALACFLCFWQWGLRRCRPDVVGALGRGRLVAMCNEHLEVASRYDMRPARLLPARVVEQRLLATYAVDALAR